VPEEALEALVRAVDEGQRLRSGAPLDGADRAAEAAEFTRCEAEELAAAGGAAPAEAEAALPGRTTGSVEWRAARGELGSGAACASTAQGGAAGGGGGGGGGGACAAPLPGAAHAAAPAQAALKALVHAHFALLTAGCAAAAGACGNANCAKGAGGAVKSANEAAVRALALAKGGVAALCLPSS